MTPEQQKVLAIARARRRRAEAEQTQEAAPAQEATPSAPVSQRGTFVDPMIGQGLLMGAGDEIKARLQASLPDMGAPDDAGIRKFLGKPEETYDERYARKLAGTRADLEGFRERHPILSPALEVGGAITGVVGTGGASLVPRAATTVGRVALAGGEGAALGGLYGFNAGEGNALERAPGAVIGAGVGGLTGGVAGSIGARSASRAANRTVPTTDDLRAASQQLYDQADQAGVVIRPQVYDRIANNIALIARNEGMDHGVHPKAGAAITRILDEVGTPKTLREMDTLRKVLRGAAKSPEPDERRIASIMIDAMDQQLDRLQPAHVIAGDPRAAVQATRQARQLWSRMSKGEVIEEIMENARLDAPNFSGSGMENALRTGFRHLAKNPKRMRGFTEAEQEAIRRVARGGPVENTLRMLGKFAPTGVVSSALSSGIGYGIAGPVGAAAVPIAGFAARRGASNMTAANAERASQMVRGGGRPQLGQLTREQRRSLAAAMASGLPVGAQLPELVK